MRQLAIPFMSFKNRMRIILDMKYIKPDYLENGILKGRCTCFTATRRQKHRTNTACKRSLVELGWGRRRGDRRAEGFTGCLRRVVDAAGRLGYFIPGLERRNSELRRPSARADGWRTPGGIESMWKRCACSRASWAAAYDNTRQLVVLYCGIRP